MALVYVLYAPCEQGCTFNDVTLLMRKKEQKRKDNYPSNTEFHFLVHILEVSS